MIASKGAVDDWLWEKNFLKKNHNKSGLWIKVYYEFKILCRSCNGSYVKAVIDGFHVGHFSLIPRQIPAHRSFHTAKMPFSHHSHSGQFCAHAKNTLEEMVQRAIARGMKVYSLTEHMPRDVEDFYPEEVFFSIRKEFFQLKSCR